ncbi:zinc finger protein 512B [Xenopus laevis]|uniref:Zinc finger protein 512B n=2 Tax=Xenopus laevis TaxID=8355 RepID=A0A1L8ELW3_XENLA|nr:zinc finger protein 512B [Xenopus laevis]OCT60325.1 hypothetical protein XELAEV_18046341mg [Xenopus laevis]
MAHPISAGSRRHFPRISKSRALSQTSTRAVYSGVAPASVPVHSTNKGSDQRRFQQKQENHTLGGIPATVSSRRLFPCAKCEAVFASKLQLQKHLVWNHSDKDQAQEKSPTPKAVSQLQKSPRVSGGKSRPQRFAKKPKLVSSAENGKIGSHGHKQRDACLSDEDPERMRHRRKQKTPKKFTGEQPSITGTFGLKGLGKAEDKSGGRRGKGIKPRLDESWRRVDGANASQEQTALLPPGSVEDRCPRQISKRGEVLCPNCKSITRKTMAGLRKHMEVCEQLQEALRCQHCRKQFKSKAGLNYHTMAEHVTKSPSSEGAPLDEQKERERLRKVLKQMGKLRCPNQDCSATFSSLMGYQYHTQRCGKKQCEWAKLSFPCPNCSKEYQSKAGRDYHVRSEHGTEPALPEIPEQDSVVEDFERTPSGRIRRQSAQVAIFHLQEIAEDELVKDGGRRKTREDLVPDTKRLNYLRPGLPTFNPQLLDSWKNRVKEHGFICCPNICCEAVYSSVSGLKAHLANCSKGNHLVGKYRCLLCQKEFSSESGVKYHILKTHSQNWFRLSSVSSMHKRKVTVGTRNEQEVEGTGKKRRRKAKERLVSSSPTKVAAGTMNTPSEKKTQPKKQSSSLGVHSFSASTKGTARMGGPSRRVK